MKRNFTVDENLELKDAGLIAASAAAQVGGEAQILDMGDAFFEGHMVVDISAIEIASNDEIYTIVLQGSNSATFASGIQDLVAINVGAAEVLNGDIDSTTGRIAIPVCNEFLGTVYRYLRAYTVVDGTVATGINYTARLSA